MEFDIGSRKIHPGLFVPGNFASAGNSSGQAGKDAFPAGQDIVDSRKTVKIHIFIINNIVGFLCPARYETRYDSGNKGGVKIFQDTDPLVSFHDIKVSHKFAGGHWFPDTFFQMGAAEIDPFGGKFRMRIQKGHIIRRKGCPAADTSCSRYQLRRNLL